MYLVWAKVSGLENDSNQNQSHLDQYHLWFSWYRGAEISRGLKLPLRWWLGVCTSCARLQYSIMFTERGNLCVLDQSERSRLWLLSEVEVWVQTIYFTLSLRKGWKSHQRTKA